MGLTTHNFPLTEQNVMRTSNMRGSAYFSRRKVSLYSDAVEVCLCSIFQRSASSLI